MSSNSRGKRLGETGATSRLGALLVASMQPTDTGEPWIDAEDVARRVSQHRKRRCPVQEVTAALRGDSVPATDIVRAAVDLRAEQRRADAESTAVQTRHAEDTELLLQALLTQETPGKTRTRRIKLLAGVFRKRTVWAIGVVATAVLTLVATGVLPDLLGQVFNGPAIEDKFRPGPAVLASASLFYPDGLNVPVVTVMPGNYHLSSALIRAMSRPLGGGTPALLKQEHAQGVQVGAMLIRLILEGNRNQLVRILDIQPVQLKREAPLGGVLLDMYPQGGDGDIQMGFDLDKLAPQAVVVTGGDDLTNQFYFSSHTISLKNGEQVVLMIQAISACYDASFDLAVNYKIGTGATMTDVISNSSRPFEVTGLRENVESYRQVFALQSNYSATQLSPPEIARDYPKAQAASCPP